MKLDVVVYVLQRDWWYLYRGNTGLQYPFDYTISHARDESFREYFRRWDSAL